MKLELQVHEAIVNGRNPSHIFHSLCQPESTLRPRKLEISLILYAVRSKKWKQIFSALKPFAFINDWYFESSLKFKFTRWRPRNTRHCVRSSLLSNQWGCGILINDAVLPCIHRSGEKTLDQVTFPSPFVSIPVKAVLIPLEFQWDFSPISLSRASPTHD